MKLFVTGVGGQLGHDVVNEALSRGHEVISSDIALTYSGIQDGSHVCTAPYIQLDITDDNVNFTKIRTNSFNYLRKRPTRKLYSRHISAKCTHN